MSSRQGMPVGWPEDREQSNKNKRAQFKYVLKLMGALSLTLSIIGIFLVYFGLLALPSHNEKLILAVPLGLFSLVLSIAFGISAVLTSALKKPKSKFNMVLGILGLLITGCFLLFGISIGVRF